MKLALTSDLHGFLPLAHTLPKCDVFVIAGDVCPVHDHRLDYQWFWLDTIFRHWLTEVSKETKCKAIIGIAGNHDFVFEQEDTSALFLPWRYLEDSGTEVDGVKFWGLPHVPNLMRWAFHAPEQDLLRKAMAVPDDTNVVISHGPPYETADKVVPRFGGGHVGDPGLNHMLSKVLPDIFVCGHIHEAYGHYMHRSGTPIYNVSHVDENYDDVNAVVEVTL